MKHLFLIVALALGIGASAQQKVVADKIVGIVGDKIILRSDITNAVADIQRQGGKVNDNTGCAVMSQSLVMKALVLQAEKDSVVVSDEEIEAFLDNKVRGFINMYGSKEALEEIAGRSVYQIKEDFRHAIKEQKLAERMRDKIVEGVKITPQEVKAYFDKIPKDSLLFYESQVEIGQIVVYPKASRDLEKLAIDELNEYKKQVESGQANFATLASLYSDDPGSKNNGGQYSINRTEKVMDPAFVQNAFRLKESQISPVFKSKFGYHIIQMVNRAGDDAVVRHILRIPKVTDDEIKEAVSRLDSVRSKLIAGTVTFGEAVSRYSDDENSKYTGGMMQNNVNGTTYLTFEQLDKDLIAMLDKDKLKPGEYSKPTPYTDERQKQSVRILYLKSRTDPHRENLKDDYNIVAQRALEIKKQLALEKWFASKIPNYYIMIDDEYKSCHTLGDWLQYASKASN